MSEESGGTLMFKLGLYTKEFEERYVATEKRVTALGSAIGSAFQIAAASGIVFATKALIDYGGQLQDSADQLDMNVESMQALDSVARQAGVSVNTLHNSYGMLKSKAADAAQGNKQLQGSLKALGIDAQNFVSLDADKQLELVARGFASARDKTEAYAAVVDLLGNRNAPRLNAVLKQLADEGLVGVIQKAKEAGQVMQKDSIAALDLFGDKIEETETKAKNFGATWLSMLLRAAQYNSMSAPIMRLFGIEAGDVEAAIIKATAANERLNISLRGSAATSEEIKRYEEARAAAADKHATSQMDAKQKIVFYEDKIIAATLEAQKWDKNTTQWLAAQNDLIKAQGELDQLRAQEKEKITEKEKKAFEEDLEWVKKQDAARAEHNKYVFEHKEAAEKITILEGKIAKLRKEAVGDSVKQVELDNAEKELGEIRKEQAEKIADATARARREAEGQAEAAKMTQHAYEALLFSMTNGGRSNEDIQKASPEAIQEALRRNNQRLAVLRTQAGVNPGGGNDIANDMNIMRLENENRRLQNELNFRDKLKRDVDFLGVDGARRSGDYDPFTFDRLVSQFVSGQSEQQRTNTLLEDIQRRLAPAQGNGLLETVQNLSDKLDTGFTRISEGLRATGNRNTGG